MAKKRKGSLLRSAPDWLRAILADPSLLAASLSLANALHLQRDGKGAAIAFELAGRAFAQHAVARKWETPAMWSRLALALAENAGLATQFPDLIVSTADEKERVLSALLRLSTSTRTSRKSGVAAQVALSMLLLDAVRCAGGVFAADLQRVASMASAGRIGSERSSRDAWLALAGQVPFDQKGLAASATENPEQEVRFLAARLLDVLNADHKVPEPKSAVAIAVVNETGAAAVQTPQHVHPALLGHVASTQDIRPPSVRGLAARASYAAVAELFAVERAWKHLAPSRLTPITSAANLAIEASGSADLQDQALLTTMSLIVTHDFSSTLELSLVDNDDLWYSVEAHCVLANRRLLLDLGEHTPGPKWYALFTPANVSALIERGMAANSSAIRLRDLFPPSSLPFLASRTEAWIKTLGDQAHAAWSSRTIHSLALVWLEIGATPVEAAAHTLNTAVVPSSAMNYYQPDLRRQRELAAKAFARLGLDVPGPVPPPSPTDTPIAPTDDEFKREWAHCAAEAQASYRDITAALGADDVLRASTRAMVAARRGYKLAGAGRDQCRTQPTLRDAFANPDWHRAADKQTNPSSERLLPMTAEMQEIVRVAWAVRLAARKRLIELGVPESGLPKLLVAPHEWSPLFLQFKQVSRRGRTRIAAAPLDKHSMSKVSQLWLGPQNMGRRFWVTQSATSPEWWAEQLVTGHGRGLAHVGSPCLAVPVMRLLQGGKRFVESVLSRLALPCFGTDVPGDMPELAPGLDLRFLDRRKSVRSVPSDMPLHHCDSYSLPAISVVSVMRTAVGEAGNLSAHARSLLSIIVVDGLVHSEDVKQVWKTLPKGLGKDRAAYFSWDRSSGQPIRIPVQPPTRVALDEVQAELALGKEPSFPALEDTEIELRNWLVSQWPSIQWPSKPMATIVAVGWLASRWVRLHVPPFLVEAYRPETLAATLDDRSLRALVDDVFDASAIMATQARTIQRTCKSRPEKITELQWIVHELGLVALSREVTGESQKRSRLVKEQLDRQDAAKLRRSAEATFNVDALSPLGALVLTWIVLECEMTYDRAPGAIAPGTYYEYLTRLRVALEELAEDLDFENLSPRQWRKITGLILAPRTGESSDNVADRGTAWKRILNTVSKSPIYAAAASALDESAASDSGPAYRPSAASALIPRRGLTALKQALGQLFSHRSLARARALGLLGLLVDGADRRGEACGARLEDLTEDCTEMVKTTSGLDHLKTWWSRGISAVSAETAAILGPLREQSKKLGLPAKYFFAQEGAKISLNIAFERYRWIVEVARLVLGNLRIAGHSFRGSSAMQMLADDWESDFFKFVHGPMELIHAQSIVDKLIGSGPAHLAQVLTAIGHASHRTFVRRYAPAWPLWYCASMRATQEDLLLDSKLIQRMPGKPSLLARRAFLSETPAGQPKDTWAWGIKRHWPGWRRPTRPAPGPSEAKLAGTSDVALAVPPQVVPTPQQKLTYLLLRRLGLGLVAAADAAGIDDLPAHLLEPVLLATPKREELMGNQTSEEAGSSSYLKFLRNSVKGEVGQALTAAVLLAQPVAAAILNGLLGTRAGDLAIEADRVIAALEALPLSLSVEVAMSVEHWRKALNDDLAGRSRILVTPLEKLGRQRPRVRVFLTTDCDSPSQVHAGALTLIARLALPIKPFV